MLDGLFGRGFSGKCKLLIKATRARIEVVKRRVAAKQRFLKEDLTKLLANGLYTNAYGRVEEFVAGMTLLSFYDFVERACEHILKQLSKIQKQGDCPEECREAVSLLMFTAARFADLPELRELRDLFQQRYGRSLEVSFNHKFVERLSPVPPTTEKKILVLQNIASEFSIRWDAKGFEQRMATPPVVKEGVQKPDKVKQKPELLHEKHRSRSYGDNNNFIWRRDEPEHLPASKSVAGLFPESQTPSKNKQASLTEETRKVQKHDSSDGDGVSMSLSNGKLKPRNRESAEAWCQEKADFPSVLAAKKDAPPSCSLSDQDKIEKAAAKRQEEKLAEAKSFSNFGIPPPYTKSKSSIPPPPYTRTKEEFQRSRSCSKSTASDQDNQIAGHPNAPTNNSGKEGGAVESEYSSHILNSPCPKNPSSRRRHRKSSSSSRVVDTLGDHGTKDEEERALDKLLLHYCKKPSPYQNMEKLPSLPGGEVCGPSRSASLPHEQTATKRVLTRASTFQADNQVKHVHPKLPDYDDIAAKFAALRGG